MNTKQVVEAVSQNKSVLIGTLIGWKVEPMGDKGAFKESYKIISGGTVQEFGAFVKKGIDPKTVVQPAWVKPLARVVVVGPEWSIYNGKYLQTEFESIDLFEA